MELATSYANFIADNSAIWGQAVMMGITAVGVAALMGLMISSTSSFFRMLAR